MDLYEPQNETIINPSQCHGEMPCSGFIECISSFARHRSLDHLGGIPSLFFYADRLPCQRCFHNRQLRSASGNQRRPAWRYPPGGSGDLREDIHRKEPEPDRQWGSHPGGREGRLREYRSERCQHIRLSRQEWVLWHKAEQRSGLHCGQQYRHPVHPARDCPPFFRRQYHPGKQRQLQRTGG